MATVFLTGGTGFLGPRVCAALRHHGHSIILLDRSGSVPASSGIDVVKADLLEPDMYRDALPRADVVVHLATSVRNAAKREHFRVNAEGTEKLVGACRRCNVQRLLFTSTIAVKFPDKRWYSYAEAKTQAEESVRASGLRFTILRPAVMLGPGSAALSALERLAVLPIIPVFGSGRALVQPIFVDDVVEFVLSVIEQDRFHGETLELGGPAVLTIEELLQRIRQSRTGSRGRLVHIPLGLVLPPLKAAESIGFEGLLPVSVGQLSSFRYDGTVVSNSLYESRRASLSDVARMLA